MPFFMAASFENRSLVSALSGGKLRFGDDAPACGAAAALDELLRVGTLIDQSVLSTWRNYS
jgi:hypothetical protein